MGFITQLSGYLTDKASICRLGVSQRDLRDQRPSDVSSLSQPGLALLHPAALSVLHGPVSRTGYDITCVFLNAGRIFTITL